MFTSQKSETIKTIRCPFVPEHLMPEERFMVHLQKCQFPDKKSYKKCKYNPFHVIKITQLEVHHQKCVDRKKFEEEEDDDEWGVSEPKQVITKKAEIKQFSKQKPKSKVESEDSDENVPQVKKSYENMLPADINESSIPYKSRSYVNSEFSLEESNGTIVNSDSSADQSAKIHPKNQLTDKSFIVEDF